MQTLDWALRHAATVHGRKDAIIDGATRLTYAQLAARCARLGSALQELGIRPGDRIATLMANSHRHVELHFAVPGIGALIVPINSRLAPAEMRYILKDAGARFLVFDDAHHALGVELAPLVERVIQAPAEYEELIAAATDRNLPSPPSEDSLAGLYYTGGTTGPGKGVMISHRNLVMSGLHTIIALDFSADSVFMHVYPLFHLGGINSLYPLTWLGAKQVLQPVVDPGELLATITRERVTHTALVPTVVNFMVNHPQARATDFSSLRQIIHGAAPIAPDLCRRAIEVFGCGFMQAYGMSEFPAIATLLRDEQLLLGHERLLSAGQPSVGIELVIRRPDGTPCGPRETGEITLRGPNMMRGYWNKPQATAEVMRNGWYWTGDVAWADEENYIFVVDRAKDMIVSGGENVYSVEIEAALAAHPAILECAVIGIPDAKWGEAVHAIVRLRPGISVGESDLVAHCRERIAGYKCPKSIAFSAEDLPKSGVGKILKRELRKKYWDGHQRSIG